MDPISEMHMAAMEAMNWKQRREARKQKVAERNKRRQILHDFERDYKRAQNADREQQKMAYQPDDPDASGKCKAKDGTEFPNTYERDKYDGDKIYPIAKRRQMATSICAEAKRIYSSFSKPIQSAISVTATSDDNYEDFADGSSDTFYFATWSIYNYSRAINVPAREIGEHDEHINPLNQAFSTMVDGIQKFCDSKGIPVKCSEDSDWDDGFFVARLNDARRGY